MKKNSQIQYYMNGLIVETLLSEKSIKKHADGGMLSSLVDYVKSYIDQNIDDKNKTTSILSMFAPGILWKILDGMGFKWIKWIITIGASIFRVDIKRALDEISKVILGDIESNKQISMSDIESKVKSAVQNNAQGASSELLSTKSNFTLRDARMLKLAFIQYQNDISLIKTAGPAGKLTGAVTEAVATKQGKYLGALTKIITFLISTILTSFGLMGAGSAIRKMTGMSSEFDKTLKQEISSPAPKTISVPRSTQKKFKLNPNRDTDQYNVSSTWIIKGVYVTDSTIKDLLVDFANETYQGLEKFESEIRSSPQFNIVAEAILEHNTNNLGTNTLLIPKMFHSKQEIVDTFIDDVAKHTP